jgi:hypothetical protein
VLFFGGIRQKGRSSKEALVVVRSITSTFVALLLEAEFCSSSLEGWVCGKMEKKQAERDVCFF